MKIWVCGITTPTGAMSAEDDLRRAGYEVCMPMHRRWARHARQLKAVSRPLLGRYIFIEVDTARPDDLGPIYATRSMDSVLGRVPTKDVKRLRWQYIRGDFDEVSNDPLPVGARVVVVIGEWEERLAVITGKSKSGAATVKVSGRRELINLSEKALSPAGESMKITLTSRQLSTLKQAPIDWAALPDHVSTTTLRLAGLIGIRSAPGSRTLNRGFQWRITSTGAMHRATVDKEITA